MSNGVAEWLNERRRTFALAVAPTTLSHCAQWRLVDGELRHASGRFFQVVGATAITPAGDGWQQPLLRQEEIGLLAFLVRAAEHGNEWLLQAKAEPGNVGGSQIAPTIQATESNFQRVHGGASTRYLEWFLSGSEEHVVADVLGSEIGTRFLRKRNRNAVAVVPPGHSLDADGPWRWSAGSHLRQLLAQDHTVGTEGRSVIVSAPWSLIADGQPFSRWRGGGGLRARLAASYSTDAGVGDTLAELERARVAAPPGAHEVPLDGMEGWRVDQRGVRARRPGQVSVRFVSVVAHDREVRQWCQPLMARPGTATCDLICQERDGVVRFLLRETWEPGLSLRVELGPSRLEAVPQRSGLPDGETVRLAVTQSDEGGRFLGCRTRYRIVERRSDEATTRPGDHWLTLAQLGALARQPTTLSNEARTALSLLLHWA